jgi:hypothetical protein
MRAESAPSADNFLAGHTAIQQCASEFEKFAAGASKEQRMAAWDAFRSGWMAGATFGGSLTPTSSAGNEAKQ